MTAPVGRARIQVENLGYTSAGSSDDPALVRYRWLCNDCGARGKYAYPSRGAASEAARRVHPACPA